jgi:Skp family chaperone for outer membrane proteins
MMKQRLILSLTLFFLVFFLISGLGQTAATKGKEEITAVKIGILDLNMLKREAPPFLRLQEKTEANKRLLEEFTAQVLAEHQRQIMALTGEELDRSHELAVTTQARIDRKRKELEEGYQQEEAAVMAELEAVLAKVMKDKRLDCILLKGGFQIGGEDITEKVLKTWEKWGLSFWQRLGMFFTGKNPRTEWSK